MLSAPVYSDVGHWCFAATKPTNGPMIEEQLSNMMAICALSLCAFGVLFCLLQDRDVWVFRAFAAVLFARGVMEIGEIDWPIAGATSAAHFDVASEVMWLIGWVSVAPLFWHYVCTLTSVTPRLPRRLWLHLALPVLGLLLCIAVLAMPVSARFGLFVADYPVPTGWPLAVGIIGEFLVLIAILQWAAYFAAIIQRLLTYRKRLHQYVASTARRELTWIWALIGLLVLFWIITVIAKIPPPLAGRVQIPDWFDRSLGLVLLLVILLGGLRQRPGLAPDTHQSAEPAKYEKSALTAEMAARIERKLRLAMTTDNLHRDANLSLWTLATHIGASPNYVSQTLNENIGESFFDFVNSYRIADAKAQLCQSDSTVLMIAYDVGFNSRSSFYTAFKKVAGVTPTQFRSDMSDCA